MRDKTALSLQLTSVKTARIMLVRPHWHDVRNSTMRILLILLCILSHGLAGEPDYKSWKTEKVDHPFVDKKFVALNTVNAIAIKCEIIEVEMLRHEIITVSKDDSELCKCEVMILEDGEISKLKTFPGSLSVNLAKYPIKSIGKGNVPHISISMEPGSPHAGINELELLFIYNKNDRVFYYDGGNSRVKVSKGVPNF